MSCGAFITFEGGEGVGKSTQIARLANRLKAMGREVVLLREPGSTRIGEQIRDVLLDTANVEMHPVTELLLYEAARAQLLHEQVLPALERGAVVLCDRFYDSTMAYQGYARGLGPQLVRDANVIACGQLAPNRTIVLVREASTALRAAASFGADRIEAEPLSFHNAVAQAFQQIAADEPERVRLVPVVDGDIDATEQRVYQELRDVLELADCEESR